MSSCCIEISPAQLHGLIRIGFSSSSDHTDTFSMLSNFAEIPSSVVVLFETFHISTDSETTTIYCIQSLGKLLSNFPHVRLLPLRHISSFFTELTPSFRLTPRSSMLWLTCLLCFFAMILRSVATL
jgi:hypothetical protein